MLCIGGMSFGESGQLILCVGLFVVDGQVLWQDEIVEIDFGDWFFYVGIVGDGVVFLWFDVDGFVIEMVNVDQVSISMWWIIDCVFVFCLVILGFNVVEGEYNWMGGD